MGDQDKEARRPKERRIRAVARGAESSDQSCKSLISQHSAAAPKRQESGRARTDAGKHSPADPVPLDVPEHAQKALLQNPAAVRLLAMARAGRRLVVHTPRKDGEAAMLRRLTAVLTLEKLAADPNGRATRKPDVAWLVGVTDLGGVVVCGPSRAHGWSSAKPWALRAGAEFWLGVMDELCGDAKGEV
jgi:hypothetical protein